jgi:hypothetical protein
VYRWALEQLKPVFAVCPTPPASSPDYRVLPSDLFGSAGYWVVPHPVEDRAGEYMASYRSEFLQARYCVYVKDTIIGALALHNFAEMVRKAFGKNYRTGEFEVSRETAGFTDKACVDVVEHRSAFSARGVEGRSLFSSPHPPRRERGVAVLGREAAVWGRLRGGVLARRRWSRSRRQREWGELGLRRRYVQKNSPLPLDRGMVRRFTRPTVGS